MTPEQTELEQSLINYTNSSLLKTHAFPYKLIKNHLINQYDELIIMRPDTYAQRELINDYLRFCICTLGLTSSMLSHELSEMHRWIVRSLTHEYTGKQGESINPNLLLDFIDDNSIRSSRDFYSNIIEWLGGCFYYCRTRAALYELANDYALPALVILRNTSPRGFGHKEAYLLSQLMGWAAQNSHNLLGEITDLSEAIENNSFIEETVRAKTSLSLATASGRGSHRSSKEWAAHTNEFYLDDLPPQEKLQILVTLWEPDSDLNLNNKILELTDIFKQKYLGSRDSIEIRNLENSLAFYTTLIAFRSMKSNNADFIIKLASKWYKREKAPTLKAPDILWICSLSEEGAIASYNGQFKTDLSDSTQRLVEVTKAGNLFNGTSFSINGLDSSAIHIPDRSGVPDSSKSQSFEDALFDSYFPSNISEFLKNTPADLASQVIFPTKPYPFQGVQVKRLGKTWPLCASFSKPAEDAPLKKVALWSGAGSMTEKMEIEALTEIFITSGITVETYDSDTLTSKDFIELYARDDIQAIWLVSHGEYNHFDSLAATLDISKNGEKLNLTDLLNTDVIGHKRRLLLLNVCDGATHPGNGLLPRLGFAGALARYNQATISNLWPVHGYAAAAFGCLLAINLASRLGYFRSYESAIHQMATVTGIAEIIETFIGKECELTERLKMSSMALSGLDSYGSPAFYQ